jgi:hypothetical protein
VLVEEVVGVFHQGPKRLQKVRHERVLGDQVFELLEAPAQLEPRVGDGAGVSEQQDDGDVGKVGLDPFEHEVDADVLDEPLRGEAPAVVLVDPVVPDPARQDGFDGLGEALVPIARPQVLVVGEVLEQGNFSRVKGLEHHPVAVVVVDYVADPGGAAPARARQQDRAPVVVQVHKGVGEEFLPERPGSFEVFRHQPACFKPSRSCHDRPP